MGWLQKTGLNKPLKFVAKAVADPIRGVGRMARGDFKRGFHDVATGTARRAAIAAAVAGGVVAAPAIAGAAGTAAGALGGAGAGSGFLKLGAGALKSAVPAALGWAKNNPELVLAGLSAVQGAREDGRRADREREGDYYRDLAFQRLSQMDLGSSPYVAPVYSAPAPYQAPSSRAY